VNELMGHRYSGAPFLLALAKRSLCLTLCFFSLRHGLGNLFVEHLRVVFIIHAGGEVSPLLLCEMVAAQDAE
jgi:hypothetical protein